LIGLVLLSEKTPESLFSPPACPQRSHENTKWRPSTSHKKQLQNETYFASTLILHFSDSRNVKNKFLSFRSASSWYFVTTALTNTDTAGTKSNYISLTPIRN
jgi:hypothetical protein